MPRRASQAHAVAAEIASAQDGLITAAQLAECGFPPSSVNARIRSGGPWVRVLPGVYDLTAQPLTPARRHRAALLYTGPLAVLSGRAALTSLNLRSSASLSGGAELVLIDHGVRRQSSGFVVVERSRRLVALTNGQGLRIAPPPRAVIDLSRHCTSSRDVDALITEVLRRELVEFDELVAELKRGPIRGSARARAALDAWHRGAVSSPEAGLLRRWRASSLPPAEWNCRLYLPDGTFLASPDAYLPDLGLAVEVDSHEHHAAGEAWRRTLHRHSRMTAHGLTVLHYAPARIAREGEAVIREIQDTVALCRRTQRKRPDLRIVTHRATGAA
jgi:hypothetical protein